MEVVSVSCMWTTIWYIWVVATRMGQSIYSEKWDTPKGWPLLPAFQCASTTRRSQADWEDKTQQVEKNFKRIFRGLVISEHVEGTGELCRFVHIKIKNRVCGCMYWWHCRWLNVFRKPILKDMLALWLPYAVMKLLLSSEEFLLSWMKLDVCIGKRWTLLLHLYSTALGKAEENDLMRIMTDNSEYFIKYRPRASESTWHSSIWLPSQPWSSWENCVLRMLWGLVSPSRLLWQ